MRFRTRMLTAPVAAIALAAPVVVVDSQVGATPPTIERTAPTSASAPDWQPCFEDVTDQTGVIFECADLTVPRDYDRPWIGTLQVAMTRIPASDPANRRGSILLNPGGPGGSGIDFVVGFGPAAGLFLGPAVPQQFDLIGFDPRGIARSTPIRCFRTLEDAVDVLPDVAFPLTNAEVRNFKRSDFALARACRTDPEARTIGRHMSTANVARDMDSIRRAVGDDELNFLGLSYGTFLGATYVNLFPDRVGAVVVDGVLDPVAWVNEEAEVPFSTRLRSDEGAAETLQEFFAQCDAAAPGNCDLAPNSEARYAAVAKALRKAPVEVTNPFSGETLTIAYQDLIGFSLGFLYDPFGYAELSQFLAFVEAAAFDLPTPTAAPVADWSDRFHREREPYPNFVEGFPAVACADTNNPRSYGTWRRAAAASETKYGYFGRIWTWASSPCASWSIRDRDRYEGPFTAETANPVLVIGNLYDPATRYEGAQTLRSLLPNSALLTVDAPGHTSLGLSLCAGLVTGAFLLDPSIASSVDGETCPKEYNAFDIVGGPPPLPDATTTDATPDVRSRDIAPADAGVAAMIELRELLDDTVRLIPPAASD